MLRDTSSPFSSSSYFLGHARPLEYVLYISRILPLDCWAVDVLSAADNSVVMALQHSLCRGLFPHRQLYFAFFSAGILSAPGVSTRTCLRPPSDSRFRSLLVMRLVDPKAALSFLV